MAAVAAATPVAATPPRPARASSGQSAAVLSDPMMEELLAATGEQSASSGNRGGAVITGAAAAEGGSRSGPARSVRVSQADLGSVRSGSRRTSMTRGGGKRPEDTARPLSKGSRASSLRQDGDDSKGGAKSAEAAAGSRPFAARPIRVNNSVKGDVDDVVSKQEPDYVSLVATLRHEVAQLKQDLGLRDDAIQDLCDREKEMKLFLDHSRRDRSDAVDKNTRILVDRQKKYYQILVAKLRRE
ncbi:hypothetical protein HK405_014714, partial [Cladochytrium tenue]